MCINWWNSLSYNHARKWISSANAHPPNDDPEDFGCLLGDHKSQEKWYDSEEKPKLLDIILEEDDMTSAETPEESEAANLRLLSIVLLFLQRQIYVLCSFYDLNFIKGMN